MPGRALRLVGLLLLVSSIAGAQTVPFTARVEWTGEKSRADRSAPGVVVWLVPTGDTPSAPPSAPTDPHPRLAQKDKTFLPHVLVVRVGSVVEFPNRDPFFHNVFSLFEGKRFDLGLYEAGTTREVHFNRPGVSYIFCNIHPEMSAVIIAIPTPYYAVSNAQGEIVVPNVAVGHYLLHIWYESAPQEELDNLTREVIVSERNSTVGALQLAPPGLPQAHRNKYGRDYDPPAPPAPGYPRYISPASPPRDLTTP
jgi:plastocyanin